MNILEGLLKTAPKLNWSLIVNYFVWVNDKFYIIQDLGTYKKFYTLKLTDSVIYFRFTPGRENPK